MAPAKRRKGSIMSINKTLKSKLLFISITDSKNSGKIKPIIYGSNQNSSGWKKKDKPTTTQTEKKKVSSIG